MNHEERLQHLEGLAASRVWNEIICPTYQARLRAEVEALVASSIDEDQTTGAIETILWALALPTRALRARKRNRRRGRIKALEALLSWPQSEIKQNQLDNERTEEYTKQLASEAMEAHFAQFGWHSPYSPPDNLE